VVPHARSAPKDTLAPHATSLSLIVFHTTVMVLAQPVPLHSLSLMASASIILITALVTMEAIAIPVTKASSLVLFVILIQVSYASYQIPLVLATSATSTECYWRT